MMRKRKGPSLASPSRRSRVTPGRSSTSASFWPTRRLNRVDLPTFGRPTMATVAVMMPLTRYCVPLYRLALLRDLGRSRGDDRGVDLEAAAQRLRRLAVSGDLVEAAAGAVVVALLEGGEAEHLTRGMAPGVGGRRQPLEGGLGGGNVRIEAEHCPAESREVLQDGRHGAVGGERVERPRALVRVLLSGLAGKAEAGKKAIAGGLVARQRAQHLRRVVSLAFLVETEGLLVTGGGVLGAGALEVLPIAPAADRGDDQHGQADAQAIVALPDLRDAVAAILLVDLADEFVRLDQDLTSFAGAPRQGASPSTEALAWRAERARSTDARQHRHADQPGVEPEQEGEPDHGADRDGDEVVAAPRREGRRAAVVADLVAPLDRDAGGDGPGEDRAEEDDRAEVAVGDKVGRRPDLHAGEHGVLERGLDPPGDIGR